MRNETLNAKLSFISFIYYAVYLTINVVRLQYLFFNFYFHIFARANKNRNFQNEKNIIININFRICFWGVAQNIQTFTLSDCINYAEQHNLTLQTATLAQEISEINLNKAKLNRAPTLAASASQGLNHTLTDGISLQGNYGINMGLNLFEGLYNYHTIKQNKIAIQQTEYQREKSFNQLKISIIQTYLSILMNAELQTYQEMVLATSKKQYEQGEQQFKVGQILESDFLMLKAQYYSDSLSIENNKIETDNLYITLHNLLTLKSSIPLQIVIPDSTSLAKQLILPELSEILQKTINYIPDIKIDSSNVSIAQYDVKIAQSSYYPSLSLNAGISTGWNWLPQNEQLSPRNQIHDRFGESIGLNLSIPIYNRNNIKNNVKIKKIQVQQAELQLQQTLLDIEKEIKSYYYKLCASINDFHLSEIKKNAYWANYETYCYKFEYGTITTADLLQQQTNYLNILHTYMQNKYSFLLERKILDVYMGVPINL